MTVVRSLVVTMGWAALALTMAAAMLLSFIAIVAGLCVSYMAGAAPGGVTALVSVALLLLVLVYRQLRAVR